jgi:hypothetical protein
MTGNSLPFSRVFTDGNRLEPPPSLAAQWITTLVRIARLPVENPVEQQPRVVQRQLTLPSELNERHRNKQHKKPEEERLQEAARDRRWIRWQESCREIAVRAVYVIPTVRCFSDDAEIDELIQFIARKNRQIRKRAGVRSARGTERLSTEDERALRAT